MNGFDMKVTINKKEEIIQDGITVSDMIKKKKYTRAAVFINGKQLLAAEYKTRLIKEGDVIKIIRIVAGG